MSGHSGGEGVEARILAAQTSTREATSRALIFLSPVVEGKMEEFETC